MAYVANLGAYAELRVVAADRLVKVPDAVSDYLRVQRSHVALRHGSFSPHVPGSAGPNDPVARGGGGLGLIAGHGLLTLARM